MSRVNGAVASGDAHLAQSIADILTTPIGSRVMRRDYGSMLFALVDMPTNAATRLLLYAATALALARWEPRLRLTRVRLSRAGADGVIALDIEGQRLDAPTGGERLIQLSVPFA